jgi:hypothetical protein
LTVSLAVAFWAVSEKEILAMESQPMRVWPLRAWPSSAVMAVITRLEQTFDWVLWIEEAEHELVWSRAARVPWKQIGRVGSGSYHCVAEVATGADEDRSKAECYVNPMCCTTFVFDTCKMCVLTEGHGGESPSGDGSPNFVVGVRWTPESSWESRTGSSERRAGGFEVFDSMVLRWVNGTVCR